MGHRVPIEGRADPRLVDRVECIGKHGQAPAGPRGNARDSRINVRGHVNRYAGQLHGPTRLTLEFFQVSVIEAVGLRIVHHPDVRKRRRYNLEHFHRFAHDRKINQAEAGDIAARTRHVGDEALRHRFGDPDENNRYRRCRTLERHYRRRAASDDHIRLERHQFRDDLAHLLGAAAGPTHVNLYVATVVPAELLEALPEGLQLALTLWIRFQPDVDNRDATHGLLSARGERPRRRRTAQKRDELAPPHSITSSARKRNAGGTESPMAFAAFRLTTS